MASALHKVFVSYSHDMVEHQKRMQGFADRLRADNIDAEIDQYDTAPSQGWQRLFNANISFGQTISGDERHGDRRINMTVVSESMLWWSVRDPAQAALWGSWIELGEKFMQEQAMCTPSESLSSESKSSAFISYHHDDRIIGETLRDELSFLATRGKGRMAVSSFLDAKDIPQGADWKQILNQNLASSPARCAATTR